MKPIIPFKIQCIKNAWAYRMPDGDYKDILEKLDAGWWIDKKGNRVERKYEFITVMAKSKEEARQWFVKNVEGVIFSISRVKNK